MNGRYDSATTMLMQQGEEVTNRKKRGSRSAFDIHSLGQMETEDWPYYGHSEDIGSYSNLTPPWISSSSTSPNVSPFLDNPEAYGGVTHDYFKMNDHEMNSSALPFDDLIETSNCGPSIDATALQMTGLTAQNPQSPPLPIPAQPYAYSIQNPYRDTLNDQYAFDPNVHTSPSGLVGQQPLSMINSSNTAYESCRSSASPNPEASTSTLAEVPQTATSTAYELLVLGLPDAATRTRVETQIKLSIVLIQKFDPHYSGRLTSVEGDLLPEAVHRASKVGDWSYIKLPSFAAIKKKNKKHIKTGVVPDEILYMEARVLKSDSETEEVFICENCKQRETKRAQRKRDTPRAKDHQEVGGVAQHNDAASDDPRRILMFNCGEYVEFDSGEVVLPTRIACYCRHHAEKAGFRIQFILRDFQNVEIARTISPKIFTTDDHKAKPRSGKTSAASSRNASCEDLPQASTSTAPDATNAPQLSVKRRKMGTQARLSAGSPEEKRKNTRSEKPYDAAKRPRKRANSISRSSHFAMTPLESRSPNPSYISLPDLAPPSHAHSSASRQYHNHGPLHYVPASPGRGDMSSDSPGASVDSFSSLMQSSATSHDAPLPSPLDRPADLSLPAESMIHQALAGINNNSGYASQPRISKLIPGSGPMMGGVEVTILGENFTNDLVAVFGDSPAIPTQFWSSNTLVCILPPSASPGPVMVMFKNHPINLDNSGTLQLFTYTDTADRALMELALQILGLKLSGRIEGAREIALRIIGQSQAESNAHNSSTQINGTSSTNAQHYPKTFEGSILRLLSLLDTHLEEEMGVPKKIALRLASREGQTLLHLATILGHQRLLNFLIRSEAPLDHKDRNGFTALHLASMYGRVGAARSLIEAGAGTFLRTNIGRTAQDIARQRDQIDICALFPTRTSSEATITHPGLSRRSSRSSVYSYFSHGKESEEDPALDSDRDSYSGDAESNASDLERRLSRAPSTVSLPATYAHEEEDDVEDVVTAQPVREKKVKAGTSSGAEQPIGQPSVYELAAAYSAWAVAILTPQSTNLPHWPDAMSKISTWEKLPSFPHRPSLAMAAFPVSTPQLDPRAWFGLLEKNGSPKESQFWSPFDQYFRGSKVTTAEASYKNQIPLYPPAQLEPVQRVLGNRFSSISNDLNQTVQQAVNQMARYRERDRRIYLIWLPALLLALGYFLYMVDLSPYSRLLLSVKQRMISL